MPIFACSQCGHIDNTACTTAWERWAYGDPLLCSLCEFGEWHGHFPRRKPKPGVFLVDKNRFLQDAEGRGGEE